jgi:hypothetical protein
MNSDLLIDGRYALSVAISSVWSQVVRQDYRLSRAVATAAGREAIVPNLFAGDGCRAEHQIRSTSAAIIAYFRQVPDNGETLALGSCHLP